MSLEIPTPIGEDVLVLITVDIGNAEAGVNSSSVTCSPVFGPDVYWPVDQTANLPVTEEDGTPVHLTVRHAVESDLVDVVEANGDSSALLLITVLALEGGGASGPVSLPGTAEPIPGGGVQPPGGIIQVP